MDDVRVAIEGAGKITEWFVPVNGLRQREELKGFIQAGIQAYKEYLDDLNADKF